VPSPTAATLYARHYHQENVFSLRETISTQYQGLLEQMLDIPLLKDEVLSKQQIQRELVNNVQGLLGYLVRWVNQGIGSQKYPISIMWV
jgi:malate synthase